MENGLKFYLVSQVSEFPPSVAVGFASRTISVINTAITVLMFVLQSVLPDKCVQASASGRALRDAAAKAMQGWHSQRLLGNGEVSDPVIKVWLTFDVVTCGSCCSQCYFSLHFYC